MATSLTAAAVLTLLAVGVPVAAAALPDFGSEPVQDTSSASGSGITDVRVGANEGFDRFVVEFEGDIGAYFVSYVDQVTQDGSGAVVPVEGTALLQVSLNGIPNEPSTPQQTIEADLTGLMQVVGAGAGFEGSVSYGLGTAQAAGFRVFTLTEPSRLVVDIAHPDITPTASNTSDPSATAAPTEESSPTAGASEVTQVEAAQESD
ncbi:MAG: hypothetical protein M3492_10220 [Actinomycetota bacterium]|nr:hypothetical protein [Actinomycetota bacterium]